MKTYKIQDREAGNVIDTNLTKIKAEKLLINFEKLDKADGSFTPNFYEIVEEEKLTSVQRRNARMDKIFAPEIARLKKVEVIADEILTKIESLVNIDPCGLDRCHLINAIQRILSEQTTIKS